MDSTNIKWKWVITLIFLALVSIGGACGHGRGRRGVIKLVATTLQHPGFPRQGPPLPCSFYLL